MSFERLSVAAIGIIIALVVASTVAVTVRQSMNDFSNTVDQSLAR